MAQNLGWDCSPRGERGYSLDEVAGIHPYTPIVTGNTPEHFGTMLRGAINYAADKVALAERLITVFAWQEPGESGMLIPRIDQSGHEDDSYLKT